MQLAYRLPGFALWLIATSLLTSVPASAQDTLRLTRLSDPIVDGHVNEPAWEDGPVLPLTQLMPQYRGALTERTEIRVAYDDEHIYVSGRMYDSDPDGIRANTVYRDAFAGDDLFSIALDTYNGYQTAVWLVVNPAGGRIDQTLATDGERTDFPPYNLDWNSYRDAATSRDDAGWYAEMRIPFTSLPPVSRGRALIVKYTHTLVW